MIRLTWNDPRFRLFGSRHGSFRVTPDYPDLDCPRSPMLHHTKILPICLLLTELVLAIPAVLRDKQRPFDFDVIGEITILTTAGGEGYDSDQFCSYLFQIWWLTYLLRRSGQLKKRRYVPAEMLAVPFTNYGTTVPVEGFAGESLLPGRFDGWRSGLYGCYTGCQDLRKTYEWILAIQLEDKQQVRAKGKLGFKCEEGLISLPEVKPSRREPETPEEVKSAMDTLATAIVYKYPTKTDKTSMEGETGEVTKCVCVRPTGTQSAWARAHNRDGPDPKGYHVKWYQKNRLTNFYERGPNSERPSQRRKRQRVEKASSSDDPQLAIEDFDFEAQEPNYEPMQCFDFAYPDLDMPNVVPVRPQNQRPDFAMIQQATDLVRAALITAPDFDDWYERTGGGPPGVQPPGKGP